MKPSEMALSDSLKSLTSYSKFVEWELLCVQKKDLPIVCIEYIVPMFSSLVSKKAMCTLTAKNQMCTHSINLVKDPELLSTGNSPTTIVFHGDNFW